MSTTSWVTCVFPGRHCYNVKSCLATDQLMDLLSKKGEGGVGGGFSWGRFQPPKGRVDGLIFMDIICSFSDSPKKIRLHVSTSKYQR